MNGIINTVLNGFGFITVQNYRKNIFFHQNDLMDISFNELIPGDYISFNLRDSNKGLKAENIRFESINFSSFGTRIRNGRLETSIELPDGIIYFPDGTAFNASYYVPSKYSKWEKILKHLDDLINNPNVKEKELQDFIEEYPELIIDDNYTNLIPQATIITDRQEPWNADFILTPIDSVNFSRIIELKLPKEKISLNSKSGHNDFSKKLFKAIRQLKDYHDAFNSINTCQRFKEKYGVDIFKPDLQLIYGRRSSITDSKEYLRFQRSMSIEIKDWDTWLNELRIKFK